jgi:tetratricopeptide (TPR) repeat protein
VALKVLPLAATMDPRRLQRFHNEARAAACLHHTNIVPVFAVGCERGVHFYAMQLIDGVTLAGVIRELRQIEQKEPAAEAREGAATTAYTPAIAAITTAPAGAQSRTKPGRDAAYYRKVAELGAQAAEALDYAHQVGVVHRDVKPGNLMLDGRGSIWVTDFGLAQMQHGEGSLTMTGDLVGTLRYMSPEQALGKRVVIDHRTDVYSLGVTLYEMLTLRPVFGGQDREELLRQIALEEPVGLRKVERGIPAELETIVLKAMEKNPQDRYASARELAEDLRRWLDHRPIQARRVSWAQRIRKWGRRHRGAVGTALVGAMTAVAVLAASVGWVLREAEIHRAETAAREAEIERAATADLEEAQAHLKGERWLEVTQALRRVEGRLAVGGPAYLREGLEQVKRDLAMVDRLDKARMLTSSHPVIEQNMTGGIQAYAAAFVEYGVDPLALSPAEAAGHIREAAISEQLVTALDEWSFIKERMHRGSGKSLQAVARLADDDLRRQRLRDLLAGKDVDALDRFAKENETLNLPPLYLIMLGQVLADRGRSNNVWRRAQQRYPRDFWINALLGASLMGEASGDLAVAMEIVGFFRVALAVRPESPHTQLLLGRTLRAAKKWTEAEDAYRKSIALDPGLTSAFFELAGLLYQQGKLDEAIDCLQKAVALDPKWANPQHNLGVALAGKGKMEEAIVRFRRAIELKPKFAQAHDNLGTALCKIGKVEEGIACYHKAIESDPRYAPAYKNLGIALRKQEKLGEAIACFRKAIMLDSKCAQTHDNLGLTLTKQEKVDEAIPCYRKAIELDPKYAGAHFHLGNALKAKGQVDKAIACFKKAIDIDPKDAMFHNNLGAILCDVKRDYDRAIACFRKAIECDPKLAIAHANHGNALMGKGQVDDAITAYQAAVRLANNPVDHFSLGQLLMQKGQFHQAVETFRQAHQLGSARPRWNLPSAAWLREAEQMAECQKRLPEVLARKDTPTDPADCLRIAQVCMLADKRYTATRFYTAAFAGQPRLAANLNAQDRYNAACAAAVAGCGRAKDATELPQKESARLRQQAFDWLRADLEAWRCLLDWLRADLEAWRCLMDKELEKVRPRVSGAMRQWLNDPDFAGVRGEEALAKLPEAEQRDWKKLWADVAQTLTLAEKGSSPNKESHAK